MLFQHHISYNRVQSYVLCTVCDRFEHGNFQMHSGCRVLEKFAYDFGCMEIGEVTERAAIILVREKPWIAKLPKASPDCALGVWWQHAGVAVRRNSIGVTLDVPLCEMSKLAHQPGEKASERGNRSSINPAYQRHH